MIDINIEIGIFSYAMLVLYLAWVSPETVERLPVELRQLTAKSLAVLRLRGRRPIDASSDRR